MVEKSTKFLYFVKFADKISVFIQVHLVSQGLLGNLVLQVHLGVQAPRVMLELQGQLGHLDQPD